MTTILVIEDVEALREEIMETLSYEGFEVLGAENGVLGVQTAKTYLPNLIICDIAMPELDGYGTLMALRQEPKTSMIPFIFLTAMTDKADMRQAMQLGADDYLTKPFTSSELLGAIASRLQKYNSVREHYYDEIKAVGARFEYLSHHDALTQLPNRVLFHESLTQAVLHAKINNKSLALLFLDMDNFNVINNTLGNDIGDQLFKAIAERLRRYTAPCDMVARIQGDEFAMIISDVSDPMSIKIESQKILDLLSRPYNLYGHEVFITSSIGITIFPDDHQEADGLIKNAELAMYYAKTHGRNSYKLYSSELNIQSAEYMALANSLHRALDRNEFRVFYQPLVDLQSGQIVGAEALVRWQHPDLGIIMPSKFIHIAEQTGLILRLSELILREVCEQMRSWRELGINYGFVAVNLSGQHFRPDNNLPEVIGKILQESNTEPQYLELEISERIIMQNAESTISVLSQLQTMGVKVAIDDFGTGYSSLSYLKHFPVNTLKIDRCFIQDVTKDSHDATISLAIIDLAHSLSLQVSAKGVETREQMQFLKDHGCDQMQGYFFSPSLPAAEFEKMLIDGKTL
ncbi:MAG: EAL domain-containing protein [Pseudanabaena sp.]|uniref:EAL domain-containing response regulator n=1 Tax=Pseudanabaena mucicola TaxID=71190 RepID=UPI00257665BB|nr:EAL domain-containing protein [Pseudanabaena mucicola]MCA6574215.1 EAL domain-containing protein [Pseudanabaena sp. M53BS1SP1A06MG]MCA6582164.1 EAL domain-containing protein [Pseudanabaena sp. M34BS1SP1A06MG]MCA6593453.1 EAL domain-containing protein [Pseudanabaena sp. M38BS1SP1A06MG]MCA6597464.1 EAL domain-containing protein [Pseudanabaena sp. M046S1SP1A06QC]MCA6599387.1 EAL domain-containing protein [Pseudanabaena sp. M57BS1SP1A06MG]MCA6606065.1 EAL domain-containing protein [Pseudanabae